MLVCLHTNSGELRCATLSTANRLRRDGLPVSEVIAMQIGKQHQQRCKFTGFCRLYANATKKKGRFSESYTSTYYDENRQRLAEIAFLRGKLARTIDHTWKSSRWFFFELTSILETHTSNIEEYVDAHQLPIRGYDCGRFLKRAGTAVYKFYILEVRLIATYGFCEHILALLVGLWDRVIFMQPELQTKFPVERCNFSKLRQLAQAALIVS